MGRGLVWTGVSTTDTPVVFLPLTIGVSAASLQGPGRRDKQLSTRTAYEVIGPQVFRFEYYYLLRNGSFSDVPGIQRRYLHITP